MYENKKVNKSVPVSVKCDVCNKVYKHGEFEKHGRHIIAQHHNWGNDSIDSIEDADVCSGNCYLWQLKQFLYMFKDDRSTAEIDNKPYDLVESIIGYVEEYTVIE